jgi:agmatine deiminase
LKAARSTPTAQGILLTTEECLLSEVQQRNPGVSREQLERGFHDYLGIDQVLWLNRGIAGDDTHGHVDDMRALLAGDDCDRVEPDTSDANHAPLAENLARLKAARTLDGKQFTIVELPMPRPVVFRGQRLPASYANFYIANGLVLVPTFHDPNDRVALNILAEVFPDREVIGIHCVDLVWGLGTLHCMTQQQPAAEVGRQPAAKATYWETCHTRLESASASMVRRFRPWTYNYFQAAQQFSN